MRVTKSVKALVDAMCQSEIKIAKIARTLEILGFPPKNVCQPVETKRSIQVETVREMVDFADATSRVDRKNPKSPSCNECFYLDKVIVLEEDLSKLRLSLHRLHKKVTLMGEEVHRQRSLINENPSEGRMTQEARTS